MSELAQDAELGDAQPRGRQSRIIGGGDRARGAAERAAGARCLELQCLELHSRVYTPFRWECKTTDPASSPILSPMPRRWLPSSKTLTFSCMKKSYLCCRLVYLWRAVDAEGEVLDVLVQATVSL
jgi:hypothetical protein